MKYSLLKRSASLTAGVALALAGVATALPASADDAVPTEVAWSVTTVSNDSIPKTGNDKFYFDFTLECAPVSCAQIAEFVPENEHPRVKEAFATGKFSRAVSNTEFIGQTVGNRSVPLPDLPSNPLLTGTFDFVIGFDGWHPVDGDVAVPYVLNKSQAKYKVTAKLASGAYESVSLVKIQNDDGTPADNEPANSVDFVNVSEDVNSVEVESAVVNEVNATEAGAYDYEAVFSWPDNFNGEKNADTGKWTETVPAVSVAEGSEATNASCSADEAAKTTTCTFSLAKGKVAKFDNVPVGATYTVEQISTGDYETTYVDETGTVPFVGKNVRAVVTNTYNAPPAPPAPTKLAWSVTTVSNDSVVDSPKPFYFDFTFEDGQCPDGVQDMYCNMALASLHVDDGKFARKVSGQSFIGGTVKRTIDLPELPDIIPAGEYKGVIGIEDWHPAEDVESGKTPDKTPYALKFSQAKYEITAVVVKDGSASKFGPVTIVKIQNDDGTPANEEVNSIDFVNVSEDLGSLDITAKDVTPEGVSAESHRIAVTFDWPANFNGEKNADTGKWTETAPVVKFADDTESTDNSCEANASEKKTTCSFKLEGGQMAKLADVPVGATYSVIDAPITPAIHPAPEPDYTVEYSNASGVILFPNWDGTGTDQETAVVTYTYNEPPTPKYVEIYRMYNGVEHLYVNNDVERDALKARGWKYEGIAFYTPESSTTEVHRLFHPVTGDHHYTSDPTEIAGLTEKHGWKDEGVLFYGDDEKRVPLTRLFKPGLTVGGHLHSADPQEIAALIDKHGWKEEGISFYVAKYGE